MPEVDELVERLLAGNRRALSRILTLIENDTPAGRAYVRALSNAERRHLAAAREAEPEVSGAATP